MFYNKLRVVHPIICTLILWCMLFIYCKSGPLRTADQSYSTLVVNEFMVSNQKNSSGAPIIDEDSSAADWVELYNTGPHAAQLYGIGLSDRTDTIKFISVVDSLIPPGGHYLLWGGNSSKSPLNHLGFNFSRDSSKKEKICLFDSTGYLIEQMEYSIIPDAMVTNRSYGRVSDGSTQWRQQNVPTPGKPNE